MNSRSLCQGSTTTTTTATATKTSLEKWSRAPSNFIVPVLSHLIHQIWQFFLELNSKRLYQSSENEEESRYLVFTSSRKRKIRHFHVVVVQWRQRNVQKSAMHVPSYFFLIDLNLYIVFMPFSLTSPSSLLMVPLYSLLSSTNWRSCRPFRGAVVRIFYENDGMLFALFWGKIFPLVVKLKPRS